MSHPLPFGFREDAGEARRNRIERRGFRSKAFRFLPMARGLLQI
jgi:hypothetical protein